jgi:hypothetical protein
LPDAEPVVLKCAACGLPFARVQNGALVIESRHHGDKHYNVIALDMLRDLLQQAEAAGEGLTTPRQVE